MGKSRRRYVFLAGLLLAAAAGVGMWFTRSQSVATRRSRSSAQWRVVDQQPLQTAQQLDKLAVTREEALLSRDALNLADHAVDLAFTSALRDARNHPPPENPETRQLHEKIRQVETEVDDANESVRQLSSALAASRGKQTEKLQEQLLLASAELALHRDELADAKNELLRAGGDPEGTVKRLFNQHQAAQHGDQMQPVAPWTRPSFQAPGTLLAQLRQWWRLRSKQQQLLQARQQATTAAADLTAKHRQLEQRLAAELAANPAAGEGAAAVAAIDRQSADRKTLGEYSLRIQDMQQLAQVYGDWTAVVGGQMLASVHAMLQGALWLVVIVLAVILGGAGVERLARRLGGDRRRVAAVSLVGRSVVQGLGVVLGLFVLVGSPNQLSTIIALAGAGLTVALKDFIVAFFGWFVLMGKNGIRVGDWVEINGIVGEVVEIGLLRTILLETGNWAEAGHPTGRRVTLVNSFAIEGHYFNFSTTGQWLWDTLEILVPAGQDPYPMTDAILQLIQKETESTARVAEQEWQHATRGYGVKAFSAAPAINLRPTPLGVTIIVRYITRANERFDLRSRLYQAVVELLHQRKTGESRVGSAG